MQWVSDVGVKPRPWEIVIARCSDASGGDIETEAYWTGQVWRSLGQKHAMELRVTMWAYKASERDNDALRTPNI
jgi:hypothetical protein